MPHADHLALKDNTVLIQESKEGLGDSEIAGCLGPRGKFAYTKKAFDAMQSKAKELAWPHSTKEVPEYRITYTKIRKGSLRQYRIDGENLFDDLKEPPELACVGTGADAVPVRMVQVGK